MRFISIFAASALIVCAACTKVESGMEASDEIVVIPTLQETKVTMVPSGNLTGSRIHIDGYNTTSGKKHLDGNILFDSGVWKFYTDVLDVHYYWPQKSNLDVMAYSPAKLDSTHIEIASKNTLNCTGLPMTGETQTDDNLKELVCGYKAGCKKADGAITVQMSRPFARVNFYLDEAVRSILKKIEITGIFNKGTYNVETGSWTSATNKQTLVCNVNKEYPVEINNASLLGGPFLVIPQSLRASETDNEVKLVLTYISKGNINETVTETKLGAAALSSTPTTKIAAWECGKEYNYWISLNGAANEVRMAVTVGKWEAEGEEVIEVK